MRPLNVALILLVVASSALNGCGHWQRRYPPSLMGGPVRTTNLQDDLEAFRKSDKKYLDTATVLDKYNKFLDDKKEEEAKAYRNEVVNARIYVTDVNFGIFHRDVYLERVWLNTGTDWTVIALNAAGSVIGGVGTKTALSATSAGVVGAKKSFEENVYL
ncbi:MAG: hypothetical protein ACK4WF_07340, partial [Candidatus Brocadiales bacterium]